LVRREVELHREGDWARRYSLVLDCLQLHHGSTRGVAALLRRVLWGSARCSVLWLRAFRAFRPWV